MARSGIAAKTLAIVAAVLALAAVWLVFDNPTIDDTSFGDGYSCLAPYDTVLNDADNFPGGEPPPDGDEMASQCRNAGQDRFEVAMASGAAAVLAAAVSALLALRG